MLPLDFFEITFWSNFHGYFRAFLALLMKDEKLEVDEVSDH